MLKLYKRKSIWIVVSVLMLCSVYHACDNPPGSRPVTVNLADGSWATVSNFFANLAVDGDVACVPPGTWTWQAGVDISRGGAISTEIRGSGLFPLKGAATTGGTTIIIENSQPDFAALGGYEASGSSYHSEIDNITFKMDAATANHSEFIIWPINLSPSTGTGWGQPAVTHHNTFDFGGNIYCNAAGISRQNTRGLDYRNVFVMSNAATNLGCTGDNGMGMPAGPPGYTNIIPFEYKPAVYQHASDKIAFWQSDLKRGALDNCNSSADCSNQQRYYMEDNDLSGCLATDADNSSREVDRFNTLRNCNYANHGTDSGQTGGEDAETYQNTWLCDDSTTGNGGDLMGSWNFRRSGSMLAIGNSFPAINFTHCASTGTNPANTEILIYKTSTAGILCWPGTYPDTYPSPHQPGWSWPDGGVGAQLVGATTQQGFPGNYGWVAMLAGGPYDGFLQGLTPVYSIGNSNFSSVVPLYRAANSAYTCRMAGDSNTSKGTAVTTLKIPDHSQNIYHYVSAGMDVVVSFADLIGGSAPTIADNCGTGGSSLFTWTPLTGGTTPGGMRLSAWYAHATVTCTIVVTITHDSSSAAASGAIASIRGLISSPVDQNPAVKSYCASGCTTTASTTIDSPATSGSTSPCCDSTHGEVVLSYYAVNGPLQKDPNLGPLADNILPATNNYFSQMFEDGSGCCQTQKGWVGTNGGTATSNVFTGIAFHTTNSTGADHGGITDSTAARDAIAGTLTLHVNGDSDPPGQGSRTTVMDLDDTQMIGDNRDAYSEAAGISATPCQTTSSAPFDGTSGTGCGTMAYRPSTCVSGVAYQRLGAGSWNTTNNPQEARVFMGTTYYNWVVDRCVSNAWVDAWYTPGRYPHPFNKVIQSSGGPPPSNSVFPLIGPKQGLVQPR